MDSTFEDFEMLMPYTKSLKNDGFVFFRGFFDEETTDKAATELNALYDAGLDKKWGNSFLLTDIFGKSPTFDQMMEKVLTDTLTSKVLKELVGEHLKIRGYNIRRMDGSHDPAPFPDRKSSIPHEWHRDARGEICISVLLTDVPGPDNGATALLPGSHLYPACPKRELIFSNTVSYPGKKFFVKNNIFNQALGKQLFKNKTGAYGKKGDLYIFMNDVWHGREANLHGHKAMISFMGAFATDFPFPDDWQPPSEDVLNILPPTLQKSLRHKDLPVNQNQNTIVHWMYRNRYQTSPIGLFALAKLERDLTAKLFKKKTR